MSKGLKATLLSLALFFVTAFICIGYAALSTNLAVSSNVSVKPKPFVGVYISEVSVYSTSNASGVSTSYTRPTNHTANTTPTRSGGSVTYKITFHNNSDLTYWYIGENFVSEYQGNSLIDKSGGITITTKDHASDSSETFNEGDWIPPNTYRDVYVTYTYGASAQKTCTTTVNFLFDIKMDAVHDEFLAVLNNSSGEDTYKLLTDAMNAQYSKNGSVTISTKTHPELFASLFTDLKVNIDGEEKTATIVIRRENIDGDATSGDAFSGGSPSGCEYTLYITVDSLTPGKNATVYAIAYSEGAPGMGDDWYQVGELYEGTAPVNSDGSINYAKWDATAKTYTVADGIYYNVGFANGDQYDKLDTIEGLISTNDQDIFNDIDNQKIFKKAYDIIQKHKGSNDPAVLTLKQAFEEASIFYVNHNNGQEFKVVRNKYTRAEIIPAIEKIQNALNYYYQAYPNA